MHTYKAQIFGEVPRGWSKDDVLANVVSSVSARTEIERTAVMFSTPDHKHVNVTVFFLGLNDAEARDILGRASRYLPGAHDTLLSRRNGRVFDRVGSP